MSETPRSVPSPLWPVAARVVLPGSKSETHRACVLAALAPGPVRIVGGSDCDDVRRTLAGLRAMGLDPGRAPSSTAGTARIDCGESGTTLRFLLSVAALRHGRWTLDGGARLRERPIGGLVRAWRELGATIEDTGGGAPLVVEGGSVRGGPARLAARESSQYLSSMMLVAHRLERGLRIELEGDVASRAYTRLTARMLERFGLPVEWEGDRVVLPAASGARVAEARVHQDWSAAGTWYAFQRLTGARLELPGLEPGTGQADEALPTALCALAAPDAGRLDCRHVPDQFPNLAVVAAATRTGPVRLVGGANLRTKESDRIAMMARELERVGARVQRHVDGLTIEGGRELSPATIDPARDHRIAMAFAVLGARVPGMRIADPGCVAKSYPGFFEELDRVCARPAPVAIVGQRAAGKTTLGRELARRTGLAHRDLDASFEQRHGSIAAFVAADGWQRFREREEALLPDLIEPGAIVSLGGGALESDASRALLAERAIVLWLDTPTDLVRERLAARPEARPTVSGGDVSEELDELERRRRPQYEAAADLRVDGGLPLDDQVELALTALAELGRP